MTESPNPTGVLIYDADCGFCTKSARLAERLGVAIAAGHEIELAGHGLTAYDVRQAAWWVSPTGNAAGHEAIAKALQQTRLRPLGLLLGARPIRPAAARIYRWVAANRYHLPGSNGTCRLPPKEDGGSS